MKIFLDSSNPSIASIVNICCERTDNILVSSKEEAELVIKDCNSADDVDNLDNTLYLISKNFGDIDVTNSIYKPFLPTEMIKFIKNFNIKPRQVELSNSSTIEELSEIVRDIDSMDDEILEFGSKDDYSLESNNDFLINMETSNFKEDEYFEEKISSLDDDTDLSALLDDSDIENLLDSMDDDTPLSMLLEDSDIDGLLENIDDDISLDDFVMELEGDMLDNKDEEDDIDNDILDDLLINIDDESNKYNDPALEEQGIDVDDEDLFSIEDIEEPKDIKEDLDSLILSLADEEELVENVQEKDNNFSLNLEEDNVFDDIKLVEPLEYDELLNKSTVEEIDFDTKEFENELKEALIGKFDNKCETDGICSGETADIDDSVDEIEDEIEDILSSSIENTLRNSKLKEVLENMTINIKVSFKDKD